MSLIGRLDQLASMGVTPWHRASAIGKLVLALGLVGIVVASQSLTLVSALHVVAWALVLTAALPWRIVAIAVSYPLMVSSLFLIATWGGGFVEQLILVLRPVTASLVALWLVSTTPYPDLFAPISRVLPRSLADSLFLTYRALFDLLGRTERLARALHMRGGTTGSPAHRLTTVGEGLGTLVLHGFERSHRLYAVMLLRGHSGRVCGCRHWAEVGRADVAVAAVAVVVIAAVWTLGGRP